MKNSSTQPEPKLIHSLYTQGLKTQILRIAILLDVFSPMANGPIDAYTLANQCACNTDGIRFLLECLSSFDLIEKRNNLYQLTSTAATFLVPRQRSYVGDWVLEQTNPKTFQDALQSIRNGMPLSRTVPWQQLAWLESYDTSRIPISLKMWKTVGVQPEHYSNLRILDLACGCSIETFALARQYPNVQVTCVDNPKVLEVARDLATRFSILDQVTFISGDLLTLDIGLYKYDVVLLSNVTNFFTPNQNIDVFRRIYRDLDDSGYLVLDVTMKRNAKERNEHISLYSLILWFFSGTMFYSYNDYRVWLEDAGYTRVSQLSTLWLCARK